MNLKKILLTSTFFISSIVGYSQEYPVNNEGQPTSKGIEKYIADNEKNFITNFGNFVKDTIYDVYFYVEDLSKYNGFKEIELGNFSPHDEIYIHSKGNFSAYCVDDLKEKENQISDNNAFVKGVAIHELAHKYFDQIVCNSEYYRLKVSPEYLNFNFYPSIKYSFGADFISEGIAEYCAMKLNEIFSPKKIKAPKSIEELLNPKNEYLFKYKYSSEYLKKFLDFFGVKTGIKILLTNKPPTEEEIMKPELFYSRLNHYLDLKVNFSQFSPNF